MRTVSSISASEGTSIQRNLTQETSSHESQVVDKSSRIAKETFQRSNTGDSTVEKIGAASLYVTCCGAAIFSGIPVIQFIGILGFVFTPAVGVSLFEKPLGQRHHDYRRGPISSDTDNDESCPT